jgi:hypothetical protein
VAETSYPVPHEIDEAMGKDDFNSNDVLTMLIENFVRIASDQGGRGGGVGVICCRCLSCVTFCDMCVLKYCATVFDLIPVIVSISFAVDALIASL